MRRRNPEQALALDIAPHMDRTWKRTEMRRERLYHLREDFRVAGNDVAGFQITAVAFEIANEAQREQAIRNFADQGYSPIIAAGFAQAAAVEKVAKEYPELKFAIVDMVVDLPNVQSIVFKEHEGSYIVGVLAGMASKSGKVGFVGGMDIPLIHKFDASGKCVQIPGQDNIPPKLGVRSYPVVERDRGRRHQHQGRLTRHGPPLHRAGEVLRARRGGVLGRVHPRHQAR